MSLILIFCIVFTSFYAFFKWHQIFMCGFRIPGPRVIPMLGNVQMITKLTPEKLLYTIHKFRNKYQQSFRLWLGPQLWVFLHSPEETRDALNEPTLHKAQTFNMLNVLIGNGLLISNGKHWELHRKALGPAFHPHVLNSFTQRIAQHVDILVEKLCQIQDEKYLEVSDYLFPCIMDVIIDTSMGKNLNSQRNEENCYTQAFHRASKLLFDRMVNPILFADFIYEKTPMFKDLQKCLNTVHNLMDAIIQERKIFLEKKQGLADHADLEQHEMIGLKKQKCLLDTLLTAKINQKPLTLRTVRDEVNTFVFAGVDTTTSAMSFIIYALAKYPEEKAKLLEEIQENNFNWQAVSSTVELNKLEYLDMFIKECLRLYTIVPVTGRQTTCRTKIGNTIYPAGITLWINMYGLAHDPDYFKDPFKFDPLRFEKETLQQLPPFSYIPFSGGPHVCIGRKYSLLIMKIMCIKIIEKFDLFLKDPEKELVLMSQMVLKAKNGINIRFAERK